MNSNSINNNRIAKNTMYLYMRMFLIIIIGLFTSRVILDSLGIEDFGIYNVVGGFVTLFTIIRAGLVSSTQRFTSFYIGIGDNFELKRTVSSFVFIYIVLCLLILIFAETFGLWFLINKLNIPYERCQAAFWVYQTSLISLIANLLSSPFNALIISHEKMKAFAYISIYEVAVKLLIAYALYITIADRLIVYSFLMMFASLSVPLLYIFYSIKKFPESKISLTCDFSKIKEIYNFAGWAMIGGVANMCLTQGLNILLGMFFSPVVNAARGIAVQVQSVVINFSNNFQLAVDPQIVKSYAGGDYKYLAELVFASSRITFYLLFVISLPIFLESDMILSLWLNEVPNYTSSFLFLIVMAVIVDSVSNPSSKAIMATGDIKKYALLVNGTLVLILPVSYIILKCGGNPVSVFIVNLVFNFFVFFIRILLLKKSVNILFIDYAKKVIIPISLVSVISIIFPLVIKGLLSEGFFRLLLVVLSSIISVSFSMFIWGITQTEKKKIKEFLILKFKISHIK